MDQIKLWRGSAVAFLFALAVITIAVTSHTPVTIDPQMSVMKPAATGPVETELAPPADSLKHPVIVSPEKTEVAALPAAQNIPEIPLAKPTSGPSQDEATSAPQDMTAQPVNSDTASSDTISSQPDPCTGPYPCQLAAIIDPSDWDKVFSALAFAMQSETTDKVGWKAQKTGHHGYIVRQELNPNDGCVKFRVASYIGSELGMRDVLSCRTSESSFEVK